MLNLRYVQVHVLESPFTGDSETFAMIMAILLFAKTFEPAYASPASRVAGGEQTRRSPTTIPGIVATTAPITSAAIDGGSIVTSTVARLSPNEVWCRWERGIVGVGVVVSVGVLVFVGVDVGVDVGVSVGVNVGVTVSVCPRATDDREQTNKQAST